MENYKLMTKEQLLVRIGELETTNDELLKNVDELRFSIKSGLEEKDRFNAELEIARTKLAKAEKREERLWQVIKYLMDAGELLDDLEDAAEELAEAYGKFKGDSEKED